MEPRPETPDVDRIVRALEQRVDDLTGLYESEYPNAYICGRLEEARDHLDNIRVLAQPRVMEAQV